MVALFGAVLWVGYGVASYGWVLLKGYNITPAQWWSPVHVYSWADNPGTVPAGHVFPAASAGGTTA